MVLKFLMEMVQSLPVEFDGAKSDRDRSEGRCYKVGDHSRLRLTYSYLQCRCPVIQKEPVRKTHIDTLQSTYSSRRSLRLKIRSRIILLGVLIWFKCGRLIITKVGHATFWVVNLALDIARLVPLSNVTDD